MPGRRGIPGFLLGLSLAVVLAVAAPTPAFAQAPARPAAEPAPALPPLPGVDDSGVEHRLLRMLHFEFGLITACGLADDEARAGYDIAAARLERRLGIDGDAEARFGELNLGWTEAHARWAAKNGPGFRERCRTEGVVDRDRFKATFRDTGQALKPSPAAIRGVAVLAGAVLVFVLSHLVLPIPIVRGRLVGALGEWGYLALYSAVALAAFAWVVAAFVAAPALPLWLPPTGFRHLALMLVFVAVLFVVAAYTKANPTATLLDRLPGDPEGGVTRITRHPALWGIALWAVAHMLANGDAPALVLFFGILVLALAGGVEIDHRRRLQGGEAWRALEARTSFVPFAAILSGRAGAGMKRTLAEIGGWRLALGALVFALLLILHPWFAGVPAFRL